MSSHRIYIFVRSCIIIFELAVIITKILNKLIGIFKPIDIFFNFFRIKFIIGLPGCHDNQNFFADTLF